MIAAAACWFTGVALPACLQGEPATAMFLEYLPLAATPAVGAALTAAEGWLNPEPRSSGGCVPAINVPSEWCGSRGKRRGGCGGGLGAQRARMRCGGR